LKTLIKNGYVLQGDEYVLQDVLIYNNTIIEVGKIETTDLCQVIDAKENYILPGFIDMNCTIFEPGYVNKEELVTAARSAVKGGFTSICMQPNTNPVTDNETVVAYIISAAKKIPQVNIFPYGAMTKGLSGQGLTEIGKMKDVGIIGVSDGGVPITDATILRNIFSYSKMFDLPLITACKDLYLYDGGVLHDGYTATLMGLRGISKEAEEVITARNIILARHTGAKLHLNHISTGGSVEIIRQAKKDGINITCEVQPQYFALTENYALGYNTLSKLSPPLREKQDLEAIKQGIIDGTIDAISSGHLPETIESKHVEFDLASFGISSLETTFAISYKYLVESGAISLSQLVEKLSTTPADILGLKTKGKIAVDYDADIIIMDLKDKYTINSKKFASKAKYSPFDGEEVKGTVIQSFVGGVLSYVKE